MSCRCQYHYNEAEPGAAGMITYGQGSDWRLRLFSVESLRLTAAWYSLWPFPVTGFWALKLSLTEAQNTLVAVGWISAR